MKNFVLFGKPGSGKGTQAEHLSEKYKLYHISTGDLFRKNISQNTNLGLLAQSYMDKGELVPDEVTIKMLENEIKENTQSKGFLFDGFPRTIAQAESLDKFLKSIDMQINATIALDVDEEELISRIIDRGKTSNRSDDQDIEKIQNRFNEYNMKTSTLSKYYKDQKKFFEVDGSGTVDEITKRLFDLIDSFNLP
jgi:adenylate kinase|tara:strand:+ start:669 stop:1250 length:582 start_codon:yes stop_codon:yes gene_type:complete